MLHKAFGGMATLGASGLIAFVAVALQGSQSESGGDWLWIAAIISLVVAVIGVIGWLLTGEEAPKSPPPASSVKAQANHGSSALAAGGNMTIRDFYAAGPPSRQAQLTDHDISEATRELERTSYDIGGTTRSGREVLERVASHLVKGRDSFYFRACVANVFGVSPSDRVDERPILRDWILLDLLETPAGLESYSLSALGRRVLRSLARTKLHPPIVVSAPPPAPDNHVKLRVKNQDVTQDFEVMVVESRGIAGDEIEPYTLKRRLGDGPSIPSGAFAEYDVARITPPQSDAHGNITPGSFHLFSATLPDGWTVKAGTPHNVTTVADALAHDYADESIVLKVQITGGTGIQKVCGVTLGFDRPFDEIDTFAPRSLVRIEVDDWPD